MSGKGWTSATPRGTDARASARRRGYDADWQRTRAKHLRRQPHCVMCAREGRRVSADVVDHVVRIRDGGSRLDPHNLQSLCRTHHNASKQIIDRRGYDTAVGADGLPSDTNHPFMRG